MKVRLENIDRVDVGDRLLFVTVTLNTQMKITRSVLAVEREANLDEELDFGNMMQSWGFLTVALWCEEDFPVLVGSAFVEVPTGFGVYAMRRDLRLAEKTTAAVSFSLTTSARDSATISDSSHFSMFSSASRRRKHAARLFVDAPVDKKKEVGISFFHTKI